MWGWRATYQQSLPLPSVPNPGAKPQPGGEDIYTPGVHKEGDIQHLRYSSSRGGGYPG